MNFWGENIRFLRKRQKSSQEALAKHLNMTRVKLNAQENGQTENPPAEDLLVASAYFGISVDVLLKMKLSALLQSAEKITCSPAHMKQLKEAPCCTALLVPANCMVLNLLTG